MDRRFLLPLLAVLLLWPDAAAGVPVPLTARHRSSPVIALMRSGLSPFDRDPLVYYRLTGGPGLQVRFPRRAWGTWLTVSRLREIGARYRERFPDAPPLGIHDISKRGGGRLPRHFSHRDGRDVDIAVILRNPRAGYVDATPRTLHKRRTWFLMASLLRTCDVEFIMLDRELQAALYRHLRRKVSADLLPMLIQYPGRWRGAAIRHRNNHRNHMHVRFRRGNRPLEHPGTSYLCGPAGRALMQAISPEL